MMLQNWEWHSWLLFLSAIASLIGILWLVHQEKQAGAQGQNVPELTLQQAYGETLLRMIFVYWLLYCGVKGLQGLVPLEGTDLGRMCQVTGLLSYLLTFSSVLCLPMHYVQARQGQQQVN
ncbi:hypothetical protein L3556_12055 [Candidatus Synechococcus calcipolaris G9]|uniref:Uncharacterized protein n=1 Tax=Candidatus Synechococcus calcipolaris G9 TaxID=1497997 RepID=A0ABT6F1C2_9SYNE|nr:hypothetical protein [Candidatus Synechococcus calcipolaris]MDG2991660.1 hypothetical protein [Candidatus Synechococcus calcipolaris G9]